MHFYFILSFKRQIRFINYGKNLLLISHYTYLKFVLFIMISYSKKKESFLSKMILFKIFKFIYLFYLYFRIRKYHKEGNCHIEGSLLNNDIDQKILFGDEVLSNILYQKNSLSFFQH